MDNFNLNVLKGLKVISVGNDSLTFDNGFVLNIHNSDGFNVVKPFDKNVIENLNKKSFNSKILMNDYLKSIINLKDISSELYLKKELEYDDLIGLVVSLDNEHDEFITCYVYFDGDYLINNSIKFEECESVEEVYLHGENIVPLFSFSSLNENINEVLSNLELVLK